MDHDFNFALAETIFFGQFRNGYPFDFQGADNIPLGRGQKIQKAIEVLGESLKFIMIPENDPLGRSTLVDQPNGFFYFIDRTRDSVGQEDAQDG